MFKFISNLFKAKKEEKISFGKYKGTKWNEIPNNYLLWIINNHSNTTYKKRAKEEIEKNGKPDDFTGTIYDQDGNISTDEFMNEQLRQAIKNYDDNVISDDPYQEHLNKIKQSKNTNIISDEGIYFDGEFISNEEMYEQEEREKFFQEQEDFYDLEHEKIIDEMNDYLVSNKK